MGTEVLAQHQPIGVLRSLTEVFILLRNNCVQSRHVFADRRRSAGSVDGLSSSVGKKNEDKLSLIPLDDNNQDLEARSGARVPPDWVNLVDEVQYEMLRITTRIKDLKELQQRHVSRPSFNDEKSQEEKAIEESTTEITKMLTHCHKLVQLIQNSGPSTARHNQLRQNVTISMIQSLQNVMADLRGSQSSYLNQLKSRSENCDKFFDDFATFSGKNQKLPSFLDDDLQMPTETDSSQPSQELSMKQLQLLHDNASIVREREREIVNITKSIVEINHLFKDLAGFIVDQGTVLDRIDFNIEQTTVKVKSGLRSVRKAEEYQKKNRKMYCIFILSIAVIVGLFLLVLKHAI